MKSKGTKETQGINGDAAALQHQLDAAIRFLPAGDMQPCPYPAHRGADWRLADGGPVVCGVCHPPAQGLHVERVELTNEEWAA